MKKVLMILLGTALGLLGALHLAALLLNAAGWLAGGDYLSLFTRAAIALVLLFFVVRLLRNSGSDAGSRG